MQYRLSASWFIQGAGWTSGTRKVLLQDMRIMRLPGMRFEGCQEFLQKRGTKTEYIGETPLPSLFGLPRFCGAASQCPMGS